MRDRERERERGEREREREKERERGKLSDRRSMFTHCIEHNWWPMSVFGKLGGYG